MSWDEILPAATAHRGVRYPAITMAAALKNGRSGPCLYISVRAARLPGMDWWQPRTAVRVMLGAADHQGMLRIVLDEKGQHRIYNTGGRWPKGDQTSMLRLPILKGMTPRQQTAEAVEFDYHDTWLEITLPDWAKPARAAAPAVNTAPSVTRAPFRIGADRAA